MRRSLRCGLPPAPTSGARSGELCGGVGALTTTEVLPPPAPPLMLTLLSGRIAGDEVTPAAAFVPTPPLLARVTQMLDRGVGSMLGARLDPALDSRSLPPMPALPGLTGEEERGMSMESFVCVPPPDNGALAPSYSTCSKPVMLPSMLRMKDRLGWRRVCETEDGAVAAFAGMDSALIVL